ncbi:MAG: 4-hydroxy-tetrahydrodipicolinate reductase [Acidimicrobiales bacterium]|nr:4-hydroxy-tetrahydrodipicolinate reductase [Acidimicrobiales bacterium]MDP7117209.1 4-hydroxy-tetrahydrodipicolinate reductase [Acidimicrobiales bacterium]MDP7410806.1 4-hydroxy-tetrahydrodipicolinate reductase [Acidimicrobiales bacterium]MEE1570245.1 4-hydroxy-tetrahydrodipicolinate reductase [Acidimicrobiales bacterium]
MSDAMDRSTGGIRVGVIGAGGRMGAAVCEAVAGADDMALVAAVDPVSPGEVLNGVTVESEIGSMVDTGVDVAVDFTVADASRRNLPVLASAGVHAVVGTSGLTDDDLSALRSAFTASNCLVVPNFAIGAVLMQRFAEVAAPWFETAEVIEFHHDEKVDAPSGTALSTVERMAAASAEWADDPTQREVVAGSRGGAGPADIRIHSVRMRGMVAHQEVVLGTTGQTLVIRHDTTDRSSFMPGVLLAVRNVAGLSGLAVGLDTLLAL